MEHLLKRVVISLSTVYLLLSLFIFPYALAKRFSSDVPKEVQAKILELENATGIDIQTGIINKSYSDNIIGSLLDALDVQYVDVKFRALHLIAEVIKQLNVPMEVMEQRIKPAVTPFDKRRFISEGGAFDEEIELGKLAKRVLWHMKVKEISSIVERLEFLKDSLEKRPDGNYYKPAAMNYLVEIGNNEAKKVLEDKLNENTKRSMVDTVIDNLTLSIEKIEIIQTLEKVDTSKSAKLIGELISARREQKSFPDRDFLIWLIRQLEKIDSPAAVQTLRDIWQDNTYKYDYRYEAQESLMRLKKIKAEERKVFVDF